MSKDLRLAVIAGAAVALSGCYASEHSVVAAADRVQPLKAGRYCEYDYDMGTGKPGGACVAARLARTADGSYLLTHDGESGTYTVSISSHTVAGGTYAGYAITEACYSDKDGSGCFVGALRQVDANTVDWIMPKCASPANGPDPCKLKSEAEALAALADAGADIDDGRRLVWQSN